MCQGTKEAKASQESWYQYYNTSFFTILFSFESNNLCVMQFYFARLMLIYINKYLHRIFIFKVTNYIYGMKSMPKLNLHTLTSSHSVR